MLDKLEAVRRPNEISLFFLVPNIFKGEVHYFAEKRENEHMSIQFILFNLDGTLLPMDQDEFTGGYFKLLDEKMAPYVYERTKFISAV